MNNNCSTSHDTYGPHNPPLNITASQTHANSQFRNSIQAHWIMSLGCNLNNVEHHHCTVQYSTAHAKDGNPPIGDLTKSPNWRRDQLPNSASFSFRLVRASVEVSEVLMRASHLPLISVAGVARIWHPAPQVTVTRHRLITWRWRSWSIVCISPSIIVHSCFRILATRRVASRELTSQALSQEG